MQKAIKAGLMLAFVIWAAYLTWQIHLTKAYAKVACAYAERAVKVSGMPNGFNSDLVPECPVHD